MEQPGISRSRRILFLAVVLAAVAGSSTALVAWRSAPRNTVRRLNTVPALPTGTRARRYRLGMPPAPAAMRRSPRPTASTRWAAPSPRSRRRRDGGDESGRPLFEAQVSSTRSRIGTVVSSIRRRDGIPRAASSPATRRRSSSWSVPGGRGVAYLIERDGFLFQSPITWYSRERRWDLSPGYEKSNVHFDRPIGPRACSATRTGSSRWRARSTGIGRRSSRATRSAASDATGPASSMSSAPRSSTAGT